MINDEHEINIVNFEVKTFLTEHFQKQIQVCLSEETNQSIFVFSCSIKLQNIVQKLLSLNITKTVVEKLRKDFLSVNFNLNDKFCDGNDLNNSCQNLPTSNETLAFFYCLSILI